jgi:hypothetical protein
MLDLEDEQEATEQPEAQAEEDLHHHHRTHHLLTMEEPEEGECLDDHGELRN